METVYESTLEGLELLFRGKVRDVYAIDEERLLLVQTDRISAFDVVFREPVPGKGAALTSIALHWFRKTEGIVPNHVLEDAPEDHVPPSGHAMARGRAMVVRRLRPYPVEAVVRGYLAGSGQREYEQAGSVCGIRLPKGLQLGDKLPEPIFTPATKAGRGEHDENIPFAQAAEIAGDDVMKGVRTLSQKIYEHAHDAMLAKGIILADTKFEFAAGHKGELTLVDEALTPDSSRYWPAAEHRPGRPLQSLDKQHLRDWLEKTGWDKNPPPPTLGREIVSQISARYAAIRDLILN